jgi:membrane protein EpsK
MSNLQVRKNLVFNFLSLFANIAIGIFYTPYLVNGLGVLAYGILPLALIINQYINVLAASLTSALTRFYTIALQKGEFKEASKYLNTSFLVIILLVMVLIIPLWYLVQNLENVFTIPYELLESARLLFIYTVLGFFLSLFSSIFNITIYALNRLDLLNIIKIIRVSCKFIFVIFLFSVIDINISHVGLASLMTEVILLFFSIWAFFHYKLKSVTLNLKYYNSLAFKAVGIMAVWTIVHQLGDLGLYRIDNLLVNIFWSSKESGILGAFEELGNYSIILASVISSLFGPLILIAYSKGDHSEVKKLSLDRSLSVGVLVATMIGIICGFSKVILKIWINEEFVSYSNWLIIKLALIPFYAAAGVFSFTFRAWNKVRFPAIMTIIFGLVNFVILYLLAKFSNKSLDFIEIILVVGLFFGVAQSYFLNGLYFSKHYPGTRRIILINFFKILMVLCSVICIGILLSPIIIILSDFWSIFAIGVISIVILMICLKVTLDKHQLRAITELIYNQK